MKMLRLAFLYVFLILCVSQDATSQSCNSWVCPSGYSCCPPTSAYWAMKNFSIFSGALNNYIPTSPINLCNVPMGRTYYYLDWNTSPNFYGSSGNCTNHKAINEVALWKDPAKKSLLGTYFSYSSKCASCFPSNIDGLDAFDLPVIAPGDYWIQEFFTPQTGFGQGLSNAVDQPIPINVTVPGVIDLEVSEFSIPDKTDPKKVYAGKQDVQFQFRLRNYGELDASNLKGQIYMSASKTMSGKVALGEVLHFNPLPGGGKGEVTTGTFPIPIDDVQGKKYFSLWIWNGNDKDASAEGPWGNNWGTKVAVKFKPDMTFAGQKLKWVSPAPSGDGTVKMPLSAPISFSFEHKNIGSTSADVDTEVEIRVAKNAEGSNSKLIPALKPFLGEVKAQSGVIDSQIFQTILDHTFLDADDIGKERWIFLRIVKAGDEIDTKNNESDLVKIKVVPELDLVLHRPKALDPAATPLDDSTESLTGVQTWVNLDNDDGDAFFDNLDSNGVAADDDLIEVELKLKPKTISSGFFQVAPTLGGGNIKIWNDSDKSVAFALPPSGQIAVAGNFIEEGDWAVKRVWVEGVSPHAASQGSAVSFKYKGEETSTQWDVSDSGKITVLGVKNLSWSGQANGFAPPNHASHVLDVDPGSPAGPFAGQSVAFLRVFPDARMPSTGVPMDRVGFRIELTTSPIEPLNVFLRSFDCDDPESFDPYLDPNDGGSSGTYPDMFPLIHYDLQEDNRGSANGQKAGWFDGQVGGVASVPFVPGETSKSIAFTVSKQPGDNYRVAAHGDKDFLLRLRNQDEIDSLYLVDPAVGALPGSEIQNPPGSMYESEILTVWRFLHVETDSIGPVSGNKISGHIIEMNGNNLTATEVKVDQNLDDGSEDLDPPASGSPVSGKGRFEKGTLRIAGTHDIANLTGNGDDFFRKTSGIDVCSSPIPFSALDNSLTGSGTMAGEVTAISGGADPWLTIQVFVHSGTSIVWANFIGGKISIANGNSMNIKDVDPAGSRVRVGTIKIPFSATDDDIAEGTEIQDPDNTVLAAAFFRAKVVPRFNALNDPFLSLAVPDSSLPFVANAPDETALGTQQGWKFDALAEEANPWFWTVYLHGAMQYTHDQDYDPKSEGSPLGRVDNLNGQGANVYMEVWQGEVPGGSTTVIINPASGISQAHTVAHEIGHLFNCKHCDCIPPVAPGPSGDCACTSAGLMAQTGIRISGDFNERTLNKIRSIESP